MKTTTKSRMVVLSIHIPSTIKKGVRRYCRIRGVTMGSFIREAIFDKYEAIKRKEKENYGNKVKGTGYSNPAENVIDEITE